LVIDAGCRQDFVDYDLGRAVNFPNAEMVEMFCTHGARASAGVLHEAVWRRRPPRTIVALLDAGAPIDEPDRHGLTPLRVAIRWGEDAVAEALRDRGADAAAVTNDDRVIGAWVSGADHGVAVSADRSMLDEMLMLSIQCGQLDAMVRLLDGGARIDGDPGSDGTPLGQACWRGRVEMTRELVQRGAALGFRHGGSAIGAALHGSRHCQHPEGGPSMAPVDEIPQEPYAAIVRLLLDAGAAVPDRIGEDGPRPTALLAELGIELPA
ncbi:MAG TPA: ankyrin repeat domain-containing protein, partial [Solirubrobacteraceae bacterium]